jgi:hypothetical protein
MILYDIMTSVFNKRYMCYAYITALLKISNNLNTPFPLYR